MTSASDSAVICRVADIVHITNGCIIIIIYWLCTVNENTLDTMLLWYACHNWHYRTI